MGETQLFGYQIRDGAIVTDKLANDAVTADKLAPGAVTLASLSDLLVVDGGGLNVDISAGKIRKDNVVNAYAGATVALTDNATNYVEYRFDTNVVSANVVAFTTGRIPLATVITASGDITSLTDERAWAVIAAAAGVTGSGTQNVLPKFGAGGTSIGDSAVSDDGTTALVTSRDLKLSAATPTLTIRETGQALPLGLWRLRLTGNSFQVEENTAVAGDFSTNVVLLQFRDTPDVIVNREFVLGASSYLHYSGSIAVASIESSSLFRPVADSTRIHWKDSNVVDNTLAYISEIPVVGTIASQNANNVSITGGSITGLTALAIRDTSAAFDVTLAATSTTLLTAGRILTIDVDNAARTLALKKSLTIQTGDITFTGQAGGSSVTVPASGTLATTADISGKANSGANSDITSMSGLTGAIESPTSITLSSPLPTLIIRESDQVLPAGLWRLIGSGNELNIEKNTAVAGDFSTVSTLLNCGTDYTNVNSPNQSAAITLDDSDEVGFSFSAGYAFFSSAILGLQIQTTAPQVRLRETDQALPAGLWRIRLQGDILEINKNTAVAGDFSTVSTVTFPTSGTLTTTASKLSVFAPTTSAELAGVISDETGTGVLVYNTSPRIVTSILDTNGNELFVLTATGSAVNELTIANAATTANPTITASGETNVGLTITGKGTKGVSIGNALLQKVSALSDGATPALDASLGNVFTLAAAGDRAIAVPSNAVGGQKIIVAHTASGAARTLSLNTGAGGFRFGSDITALSQTASGKTDYIGCIYNATDSFWDVIGYSKGY